MGCGIYPNIYRKIYKHIPVMYLARIGPTTRGINMQKQNKGRIAPSIAKRAKLFLEKEKRPGIARPTIEDIKIQAEKLQEGIL